MQSYKKRQVAYDHNTGNETIVSGGEPRQLGDVDCPTIRLFVGTPECLSEIFFRIFYTIKIYYELMTATIVGKLMMLKYVQEFSRNSANSRICEDVIINQNLYL